MNKKNIAFSLMISAIFGLIVLIMSCKPTESVKIQEPANSEKPKVEPSQTPMSQIPKIEIKSSEVSSLALNTVYKDYFEADPKCRKNYNELFGNEDGISSISSPCTFDISFNRDGTATKTIRLERYDKTTKVKKVIEKNSWKAKISAEQFDELAKSIVDTEIFQNWNDMILLNVVNSRISVTYPKGVRTLMSNVDAKTTEFLKLMDSFKQLDGKLNWEKAN